MKNGDVPVMLVYQRVRFKHYNHRDWDRVFGTGFNANTADLSQTSAGFRKLVCQLRHFANSWEVNPVTFQIPAIHPEMGLVGIPDLVNVNKKLMGKITIFNGKTHYFYGNFQ